MVTCAGTEVLVIWCGRVGEDSNESVRAKELGRLVVVGMGSGCPWIRFLVVQLYSRISLDIVPKRCLFSLPHWAAFRRMPN